ncbi:MAG TPA: hydrogenase formation protein HypD [Gammaproteobacteria bacterium]
MHLSPRQLLDRLRDLPLDGPLRIMNVCGGHERTITQTGLRSLLPEQIELIPGPGCPVCVCPEEAIYAAIRHALDGVTVAAYGDMLRVPVNVAKGEPRSLEEARARAGTIHAIASPQQAAALARRAPGRPVLFLAAGFETTTAPLAALLAEGAPENLLVLMAGRRTWPAVAMLLESGAPGFDALITPGHVSAVMGAAEWRFLSEQHHLPTAVAGFSATSLLAAIHSVARQRLDGRPRLDNCYPEVVRDAGNPTAQRLLSEVFEIVAAPWRGIGTIPASGYQLREPYARHDAGQHLPDHASTLRRRAGQMPSGCDCAAVVLGRLRPNQCRLFGKPCTPRAPVGPCMVSDEGACRLWWNSADALQNKGQ